MPYSGPRSVFMYLVSFLTLYLSAVGMAALTWGLADYWFEDPLAAYEYVRGPIRTGIAMVVVAYPAFLLVSINIRRKVAAGEMPESSAVKRVLTYITLFVIALTTIVDLIAVIYQFLGGELTSRSALKGGSILLIAGFVFLYYLSELREPKKGDEPSPGASPSSGGSGGGPSAEGGSSVEEPSGTGLPEPGTGGEEGAER